MNKNVSVYSIALGFILLCAQANAALITSSGDLNSASVIDFSQFDIGSYTFINGPTQVGDLVGENVEFSAQAPNAGLGGGNYGLVGNGIWTDPLGSGQGRDGYAFINNGGDFMDFTFNDGLVSGVGGFMNYCPTCPNGPALIQALGIGGNVLESWDIEQVAPISTPEGVNAGDFRGILRDQADIFTFRVWNRIAVLDDLTFSRDSVNVPEPASLILLGLGLVGIGFSRKKYS